MHINYFEEYPTEENLRNAALLDPPSTVFLASRSYREFRNTAHRLSLVNPNLEAAYWPLLPRSYWISPFSPLRELREFRKELEAIAEPIPVLLDVELPVLSKWLMLANVFSFAQAKREIRSLVGTASSLSISFITAEYPPAGEFSQRVLNALGLSYATRSGSHRTIFMMYSTFLRNERLRNAIRKHIVRLYHEHPGSIQAGLGTIAAGVFGTEGILSPAELRRDLVFCRENGINEVTIYRLGGLRKEYLAMIREFSAL